MRFTNVPPAPHFSMASGGVVEHDDVAAVVGDEAREGEQAVTVLRRAADTGLGATQRRLHPRRGDPIRFKIFHFFSFFFLFYLII